MTPNASTSSTAQASALAMRGFGQLCDLQLAATRVMLQTAQRTTDALADMQHEVGRIVESQASSVAESIQRGLEELNTQATSGLQQIYDTARQQADAAREAAQAMGEQARQGGEQLRDAWRQGGEQAHENLREAVRTAQQQNAANATNTPRGPATERKERPAA